MCALGGGAAPFRQVAEIPLGGLLVAPTARRPSADGVLPLLPDPALPGGGRFDSPSFLSALAPMLRPLRGASQALLPGEQIAFSKPTRNAQRPPADVRRPNARVRLFAVSGIADFGARLQGLVDSAPQWLEVRLMDLPGHGQRANNITTDGLPPCAFRQSEDAQRPNAGGESAKAYVLQQLTDLVEQLVDEMWPLLLNGEASRLDTTAGGGGSSGFVPYALLGFSFGAMLAYRIERALRKRGAPAPLLLVAVGRPAPHCMILPSPLIDHLRRCDDQEVMNFVQDKLQLTVPSKAVGVTVFARSAALFRLGLLLNGAHAGLIDPQTSASATCIYDGLPPAHASEAPKTGCSVLALGGSFDVTARELLVKRWHEVSGGSFHHATVPGLGHLELRDSVSIYHAVYAQIAARAVEPPTPPPSMPPPPEPAASAGASASADTLPSGRPPRPPPIDDGTLGGASAAKPLSAGRDSPLLRAAAMLRSQAAVGSRGSSRGSSPRGSPRNSPKLLRRGDSASALVPAGGGGGETRAQSFRDRRSKEGGVGSSGLRRSFTQGGAPGDAEADTGAGELVPVTRVSSI